jgi:uncharacterized protein (TIGR00297 family)
MQLLIGFLIALLISSLAYKAKSLNKSGAIAAFFSGTIIFGIGGWQWAVLLLAFFITSSALSRAFKKRKQGLDEKYSKGNERDAGQVFGNGGIATLFAALHFFFPHETWPWLGFAASLAAVNADTWATELGVLNPNPPRMITNLGKVVEKGTSGGISLIGTLASLAGAGLIGLLAFLFQPRPSLPPGGLILIFPKFEYFFIVIIAGLAGSLFDSLLGGTVQAMYFCPTDQKETEKHPLHTCGTETVHIRGWQWLDNDWVNFGCGLFAVIVAMGLYIL